MFYSVDALKKQQQKKNKKTLISPSTANLKPVLLRSLPSEAATGVVLQEKMFIEISQNSQENLVVFL